jgi:hypothetical protein
MFKDIDGTYVHFYEAPERFIPSSVYNWFNNYEAIQLGICRPYNHDDLDYKFLEATRLLTNYTSHFQILLQERNSNRGATALAQRIRGNQ